MLQHVEKLIVEMLIQHKSLSSSQIAAAGDLNTQVKSSQLSDIKNDSKVHQPSLSKASTSTI